MQSPTDPIGWGARGDAALALGLYDEGEQAYQTMMDLSPGLPAYARAARLRALHGDVEGAAQMWGLAIDAGHTRDPEPLASVLTGAADLAFSQGAYGAALPLYEKALGLVAGDATAATGRARCLAALGEGPAVALPKSESALASARADVWANASAALAWSRLGQFDRAAELAHSAISLGTVDATLWMQAGLALEASGEVTEGRFLIDLARSLDPYTAGEIDAANVALDAANGPMTAQLLANEWQAVLTERDEEARYRGSVALVERWRGQELTWQVRALASMCVAVRHECIVHAFRRGDIPEASLLFGTFVRVALRPEAYAKLGAGCHGAADCVVTFTGTLKTLDLLPEEPIVIAFTDAEIDDARPALATDAWAAVAPARTEPLNAAHTRQREGADGKRFDASKLVQATF